MSTAAVYQSPQLVRPVPSSCLPSMWVGALFWAIKQRRRVALIQYWLIVARAQAIVAVGIEQALKDGAYNYRWQALANRPGNGIHHRSSKKELRYPVSDIVSVWYSVWSLQKRVQGKTKCQDRFANWNYLPQNSKFSRDFTCHFPRYIFEREKVLLGRKLIDVMFANWMHVLQDSQFSHHFPCLFPLVFSSILSNCTGHL